uniref:Uncharacterized protein n=1 Tax=Anguilla anguilla TaxID=7936 RepID=A0A0E9SIY9_ANGAN
MTQNHLHLKFQTKGGPCSTNNCHLHTTVSHFVSFSFNPGKNSSV